MMLGTYGARYTSSPGGNNVHTNEDAMRLFSTSLATIFNVSSKFAVMKYP
jgi:hypothetical protein